MITCVKASQGFDWNQGTFILCLRYVTHLAWAVVSWRSDTSADDATEMFLPSYADFHFDDLERRQDPVEDIVVTDEEVKNMFPSS